MAKQRYINTKFWNDTYIIDLDPIEKLLFLYCITSPLTNIAGIYEVSIKRIAFDTGIDKDMVTKIFQRFEKNNKIKYENGWIGIKNFIKHQKQSDNENDKINIGIKSELQKVPENIRKWVIQGASKPLNYSNTNYNTNTNYHTKSDVPKRDSSLSYILDNIYTYMDKHNLISLNPTKRQFDENQDVLVLEQLLANYPAYKIMAAAEWAGGDNFWATRLKPKNLQEIINQFKNLKDQGIVKQYLDKWQAICNKEIKEE